MPQSSLTRPVYDSRTRLFHWLTAVLVLALWFGAHAINTLPKGPPRWYAVGVHMSLGISLGVLLVFRIRWRLGRAVKLASTGNIWMRAAAHAMHAGLYAALIATILLGMFNAWVRGVHVFSCFVLPAFDPGNKELRRQIGDLHIWVANCILIAAVLHAAVAIFHHVVLRDGTLERMWGRTLS